MSLVYLVCTPIGTYLSDMSLASLQAVEKTKHLFIESDSRVIQKLRKRGHITPAHRLHTLEAASLKTAAELVERDENFAILADTGNPCFVDPGHNIVQFLLLHHLERITLIPLGMSSALDAALSMCGLDIQQFTFIGHHPENADFTMDSLGRHPLVCYVSGRKPRAFIEELAQTVPRWVRMTLFGNIRDRDGSRILRYLHGDPLPAWLKDDSGDDYVAVIERRPRKRKGDPWLRIRELLTGSKKR